MHTCIPRALPMLFVTLIAGCGEQKGPDLGAEVSRLNAELVATRQKLNVAESELAAKKDEIAKAAADAFMAEANKKQSAATEQTVAEKEAQVRALQAEVAGLKKSEALVFAEACATQQRGVTSIALDRYQQFIKDFPKSPLVPHAERAIADLTKTADTEAKWRQSVIDPKRPERDVLKRFADSVVSLEEIAPLLRGRSTAEVVKLLGKPNKTFRNGAELGYVDKVLDPATGGKETLVIVVDSGYVSALRVGYRGREIKP